MNDLLLAIPPSMLWGATMLAGETERSLEASDWYRWEQQPGRVRDGSLSDQGAEDQDRFRGDHALARKLGHNTCLVSLEWSRVSPTEGEFDEQELDRCVGILTSLRKNGLTAICALAHVTSPAWFTASGGWNARDSVSAFQAYTKAVMHRLAPLCQWWIPVFEPIRQWTMSYRDGFWPPGKAGMWRSRRALHHMEEAQTAAFNVIKRIAPETRVGLSLHLHNYHPSDPESPWDHRTARRETTREQRLLTAAPWDFAGVSWGGDVSVAFSPFHPRAFFSLARKIEESASSGNTGFTGAITSISSSGTPVLILGGGRPFTDETARVRDLLDHLALASSGDNILGYIHRSLLDGFAWHAGNNESWGLVGLDQRTQARQPRPSAELLRNIIQHNGLRRQDLSRYSPDWRPQKGS